MFIRTSHQESRLQPVCGRSGVPASAGVRLLWSPGFSRCAAVTG